MGDRIRVPLPYKYIIWQIFYQPTIHFGLLIIIWFRCVRRCRPSWLLVVPIVPPWLLLLIIIYIINILCRPQNPSRSSPIKSTRPILLQRCVVWIFWVLVQKIFSKNQRTIVKMICRASDSLDTHKNCGVLISLYPFILFGNTSSKK